MTPKDEKLYIVMVGLPGRGKSTIALRLLEMFNKDQIITKTFNNGNLRRKFKNLKKDVMYDRKQKLEKICSKLEI